MSFYDAIRVGASGAADFEVERSLRFNDDDSPYLELTPSAAGSNQMTFSFWVKRGSNFGSSSVIFSSGVNNARGHIYFETDNKLRIQPFNSSGANAGLSTNMVFRDPSAWYHIVISFNNSAYNDLASTANVYVNGAAVTFTADNYNVPTGGNRLNDAQEKRIGEFRPDDGGHFDGYLAEFNFIDGQVLTPSSFGKTNSDTGQWVPIDTSGLTFGTEGFRLQFADNSGTTATTLGKDTSGQGNNWTPNNFSVAAGKDDDSSFDSPTNNLPTLSPVDRTYTTGVILSNANLRWQYNYKPASHIVRATMALPSTGKIYMEWENEQGSGQPGRMGWGLVRYRSAGQNYTFQAYNNVDYTNISFGGSMWNGTTHITGSWSYGTHPSFYTGERAALAIDCSNGKYWVGKVASNGSTTWYDDDGTTDGDPAGGNNETATLPNFTTATEWMPYVNWHDGGAASSTTFYANINFGNHSFLGTVPTGFEKLSSKVLDEPTIKLPNKHFGTILYTGNGSSQTISDSNAVNFTPDWVWGKTRNTSAVHYLFDQVRGVNKYLDTQTDAETTNQTDLLTAFNSNGFTLGANAGSKQVNKNGNTYVAWNWNAGDTDGATYTVKVVSDSGNKYRFNDFGTSAVTLDLAEGGTYTFDQSDSSMSSHPMQLSTTANGTHGGGSAYSTGVTYQLDGSTVTASAFISGFSTASSRKLIITVAASAPTLYYYCYYHSGMGGQANTNSTLGSSNFDGSIQSTVKLNSTAGFSIVKYTGNATGGATFGHGLGVAPQAVILKRRDSGGSNWYVYQHKVNSGSNPEDYYLELNSTAAQASSTKMTNGTSPTSTVFTLSNDGDVNASSGTYIAYFFSEVAGYSKFGKYTGNGTSSGISGPFVFTGFRPAWLMLKRADSADHWIIKDSKRNNTNDVFRNLGADIANAEFGSSGNVQSADFLSNGFKLRGTDSAVNANSGTYIYFAFAESPFKNSRAR